MTHEDIMKLALVVMGDGTIQRVVVGENDMASCEEHIAYTADIASEYIDLMVNAPVLYQMLTVEWESLADMLSLCDTFGQIACVNCDPLEKVTYMERVNQAKAAIVDRRNIIAEMLKLAREGMQLQLDEGFQNGNCTKH